MNMQPTAAPSVLLQLRNDARALAGASLAVILATLATTFAPPSSAADAQGASSATPTSELATVVVTARRMSENLQQVPVAVTALTQDSISQSGNFAAQDLTQKVPNLNVETGLDGNTTFAIRGQSATFGALFPSVVAYFAEVPLFRVTEGQLYDLDNIQILRGPQGTLFGRVTDGGDILLAPQKPTNDLAGYVETKLGNYNLRDFDGALNIPLIEDKLLFRAAFDVNRRDGYVTNINNGVKLGDVDYDSFRLGLTIKPVENFENYTVFSYSTANETGTPFELSKVNPTSTTSTLAGFFLSPLCNITCAAGVAAPFTAGLQAALAQQQARGPWQAAVGNPLYGSDWGIYNKRTEIYAVNTTSWHLSEALTFRNIAGYTYFKDPFGVDLSGTSFRPTGTAAPFNGNYIGIFNSLAPGDNTKQHLSEEFQASGTLASDLKYTLGTYWEWEKTPGESEAYNTELFLLQQAVVQYTQTTSQAYYGQMAYDLHDILPGLKLDGGVRYTQDTAHSQNAQYLSFGGVNLVNGVPVNGQCLTAAELAVSFPGAVANPGCEHLQTKSDAVTYTAGLDYDVTQQAMVYAKVSRGYRPGGFNAVAGSAFSFAFQPEYDVSVEGGVKADYNLGPVEARTDVALFHDDYTKIQKTVISPATPTSPGSAGITNGPQATIQGIELEQTFIPVKGLTITLAWGYTDAHYQNHLSAAQFALDCPANPATTGNVGFCPLNLLNDTPRNTLNASAHYTLPLDASVGEVSFGGSLYYRSSKAVTDTSYLNPEAVLPPLTLLNLDASWKNLMGQPIDASVFVTNATNKVYVQGMQALSQFSSIGISSSDYGPPRMFGVSFRYHFGPK